VDSITTALINTTPDQYDICSDRGKLMDAIDIEKKAAADAAADLVEDGMLVGLGTGSTVAFLLDALAARSLSIRCVSTSPRTEEIARRLGLTVLSFEGLEGVAHLDMAIDGADQVDPQGWIVKGGGAAHTREKCVAAAADRFVVIASADKMVEQLIAPIPLELLEFGLAATVRGMADRGIGAVRLREVPRSPDGGVIADLYGPIGDPAELDADLSQMPGVIDHGLFAPSMTERVVVADGTDVRHVLISS